MDNPLNNTLVFPTARVRRQVEKERDLRRHVECAILTDHARVGSFPITHNIPLYAFDNELWSEWFDDTLEVSNRC